MLPVNAVALRALRGFRATPPSLQRRLFSVSTVRPNEKPQQSFKSQLYESTQQRLKRERTEQERYAQLQTQSPGGRYAALMFGMRWYPGPEASPSPLTSVQPWSFSPAVHTI